jgi:non-ribosomal peptide synthetase component F
MDFSLIQRISCREGADGEVLEAQLAYWKRQLANIPILQLPTDRPRLPVQTYRGAKQSFVLPLELTESLNALSAQEGVTLFMTLLAVFKTLLYRYSGQADIIVGSPIAERNLVKTEGRIGVFVNTLVMRTDLGNNPSFRELLERVCEVVSRAYTHHELPFEKLVEELALERYLSHTPPFQVMFVYENSPKASLDSLNIENGAGKCDLNLSLVDMAHGLTGTFEYNTNLFDANTISRMVGHFQTLLEGIVAAPDQRLSDLPLLTADEQRQQLVAWNPDPLVYPKDLCLHQPFEIQVERKPDAVAIVFENEQLTYRDLNGRANQLANLLQKLGVKPEIPVGLYMHRSLELAVGVLGILKSGGACVPIDSEYPSERISFILEDSRVPVLLTQKQLLKKIPEQKAHVVCIDTSWEDIARESTKPPVSNVTAENIAYILYTSGSTGNPKGVMISHLGRCREFWEPTAYRLTETDRRLIQSSSFLELFWPLWVGGQGIIVRPGGHRDSAYLV